jgi:hypothetical protein
MGHRILPKFVHVKNAAEIQGKRRDYRYDGRWQFIPDKQDQRRDKNQ